MSEQKRKYRELDDDVKQRISSTLKGRGKTSTHAQNISQGMKDYWATVPSREAGNDDNKKSNPQSDGIM